MNITKSTESSSVVVHWDEVDDSLPTTYTVTWTSDGTDSTQSRTLEEQSSYTITGLTLDTVYTITVTATNKCGTGPEYRTNVSLTTDATSTTFSIIPTMISTANPKDADTTSMITTTSMVSSTSSRNADTTNNIIATTSSVSPTSITNSADKTMTGKF